MRLVVVRGDGNPSVASGSHTTTGAVCDSFGPTIGLLMRLPGGASQPGLLLCQVLAAVDTFHLLLLLLCHLLLSGTAWW